MAGLRISRGQTVNRFDAMFESLCQLRERGFVPDVVVDAGANAGQWTKSAIQVFPEANFHLIEPQPACRSSLLQLTKAHSRLVYHSCAVTRAGVSQVTLAGGNKFGGSTGAFIAEADEAGGHVEVVPASSLDALLAESVASDQRVLLKLDLEGHELCALEGATELLAFVEVILAEVQFYDIHNSRGPTFSDLLVFLRERGFEFDDVASLSSRRRDERLRMGDVIFVHESSPLRTDVSWD